MYRLVIHCLIAFTLPALSCSSPDKTNEIEYRNDQSYRQYQEEVETLIAEDSSAVGGSVWIAYPEGYLPSADFVIRKHQRSEQKHQSTEPLIEILEADEDAIAVRGSAEEVQTALNEGLISLHAVRVIQGNSFDEWPSVMRLIRFLREAGYQEVRGRPGLWKRATSDYQVD